MLALLSVEQFCWYCPFNILLYSVCLSVCVRIWLLCGILLSLAKMKCFFLEIGGLAVPLALRLKSQGFVIIANTSCKLLELSLLLLCFLRRALLLWWWWETRLEGVNLHSQPVQLDGILKEGSFSRPQETEGDFGQVTDCQVGQSGEE